MASTRDELLLPTTPPASTQASSGKRSFLTSAELPNNHKDKKVGAALAQSSCTASNSAGAVDAAAARDRSVTQLKRFLFNAVQRSCPSFSQDNISFSSMFDANVVAPIEVAIDYLAGQSHQVRYEAAMVCFRCVTTVIDLLLPASLSRGGQSVTFFFRKWVLDIYRIMVDERLLDVFDKVLLATHQKDEIETEASASHLDSSHSITRVAQLVSSSSSKQELSSPLRSVSKKCSFVEHDVKPDLLQGRDDDETSSDREVELCDFLVCVGSLFDSHVDAHHEDPVVAGCMRLFQAAPVDSMFLLSHHCIGTRLLSSLLSGLQLSSVLLLPSASADVLNTSLSTFPKKTPSLEALTRGRTGSAFGSHPGSSGSGGVATISPPLTAAAAPLLHHHAFKYPSVKHADDVRRLYERLLLDAELSLSPHDPIRAAIVVNAASCFAESCGDPASALDLIVGFLEEVTLEGITLKPAAPAPPSGSVSAALPPPGPASSFPATPSAFSVTVVSRSANAASTPPFHSSFHSASFSTAATPTTTGAAIPVPTVVQLPQKIFSWVGKDERAQFYGVVRVLKAQEAALRSQLLP